MPSLSSIIGTLLSELLLSNREQNGNVLIVRRFVTAEHAGMSNSFIDTNRNIFILLLSLPFCLVTLILQCIY